MLVIFWEHENIVFISQCKDDLGGWKITAVYNRKQEINYTTKYDTIHTPVF